MEVFLSLAPNFTTTPVALGISEAIGGIPALRAVFVIITGNIGAVMVPPLMNLIRITDWRARGFAVGVVTHGIGTAAHFS
jgi:putative effector of murein hydrolase